MTFEIVYLSMAILVGLLALGRKGGFLFHFALALIATPPGALLWMILFSRARPRKQLA